MEGVSVTMYNGLRRYWQKKTYRKLTAPAGRSRRRETIELGSFGGKRRRRVWRIKISPKLRLLRKVPSLKKLLIWIRDSYVKTMMAFADSRVVGPGTGYEIGGGLGFGKCRLKEYDDKMIVEIYKSLMVAQGRLVPPETVRPAWVTGQLPTVTE